MQWDLLLDPPRSGKSHVFFTPFFTPPVCDAGFLLSICRLQVKAKITRPLQLFLFRKNKISESGVHLKEARNKLPSDSK